MAGIIGGKLGGSTNAVQGGIPNNPVIQQAYQSASNSLRYAPEEQRAGIQAKLQQIAQGQRPPTGMMGVAAKVLGAPGIKQALTPLSVLDIPRRVVISAGKEYYDALSGNGDASFSDLYKQAKDPNFGFGDFVNTGNKWSDRILGFIGDVAFDPTTYVTLGTSKVAGFGQKVAAAGKLVDAGGDATRAARLVREGSWFLTPAERELAGISQSGLYFMGQRIKGTGKLGVAGEAAFAKGRLLVSDRQFVQAIRSAFTPNDAKVARLALKRGLVPDADTAKQYLEVIRSSDTERFASSQAGNIANAELRKDIVGNTDEKTLLNIGRNASDLLENPAALASASDAEKNFVQKVRVFLDNLYNRVNDATQALDPNAKIGYQENYFPHVMTGAGKDYAAKDKKLQSVLRLSQEQLTRPGFVEPRRLVVGEKFFGTVLEEGDLTAKRLNEIARQGGFKGDFFETNAIPVLRGYVQAHSREMGRIARFKYLDEKGVLDRVVQRAVPNADLISKQTDRLAQVVKLSADANTKSRNAFTAYMNAVTEALNVSKTANTANVGAIEIAYKSSQDALQAARNGLDEALADLSNAAESIASMFMTQDLKDFNLVTTLIDEISTTEKELNAMIEAALGSAADNKKWLDDFAQAGADVADLKATLQAMDKKFDDLAATVGKTATYQQFFATNFDKILRGEIDETTLPFPFSNEIREKVGEIARTARGVSESALGPRRLPSGRSGGLQRRLTESAWFRGITQIAPLNDKNIALMTNDTRTKILNNAARMGSTLYETESVGANMIARNYDFFVGDIENALVYSGVTDPDQVRQVVRSVMPQELVAAEDELLELMSESAGVRKTVMRDVASGKSAKTYNRKAAAEAALEQMYADKEIVDAGRQKIETLLNKRDALIEDAMRASGVKISYKKNGEISVKGFVGSGKAPNVDAIESIDEELRQLRKTIQEYETKVHTIGYGQDKTMKRFSLDANEGLKPQTRGGKKGLRGADKEKIGGLTDLEEYAANLEYRTEVMDISKGQKRAVYRAGELAKGSRDLHRRIGVAVERYNIISEVWRRSLAAEEMMAEMGLQINDNHLRVITERVLNERGKVWQDRVFQLDGAQRQLRELKAATIAAEASGDYGPVEELIQKTFNAGGKKNYLRDVVGTTDTFKIDGEVQGIRRVWDDYQRTLRQRKTAMGQMAPEQAFGDMQRTKDTIAKPGVIPNELEAAGQFVRATTPAELKQRAVETADSLVAWYNQKIGTLQKGVDYKIKDGYRNLTASGNKKIKEAIEGLQTATLPSQMIIDIAQEQLSSEAQLVSRMTRLFKNVYEFEDGKFVRGGSRQALDPYADPREILAGEYQTTPLSVAGIFKIQAERIAAQLDNYDIAVNTGRRLRGEADQVSGTINLRRGQLSAGTGGAKTPAKMATEEFVPPAPEVRLGRTKAYAKEISDQTKKVKGLKKKAREASTPQLKSRFNNQAAREQEELDKLIATRDALRPQIPFTREEEAARLRNAATEGFREPLPEGGSTAFPKRQIDAQREVNKKLVALEATPEMSAARVSQQVYETLQGLVGREMGNVSISERLVSFASGYWGYGNDGSLNKIAQAFKADGSVERFQFTRGEWASLFSGNTGIAARGNANKRIRELERSVAEFELKAKNATTNSVRSRFKNRAEELRGLLDEARIARDVADPEVRDVARKKFADLNKFIDDTAEQLQVDPEQIRRVVFAGDYVDASSALARRDSLQTGWRVSSDYALLKQYDEIATSAPMRLAKSQKEEIAFLEDRLATLRGDKGLFGSIGYADRQAEEALFDARSAAGTAARIGEPVMGQKGIPAGKPANTKPLIPTASELGITPKRLETAGPGSLETIVDKLQEAAATATKGASREYGLKRSTVKLSPQAQFVVKQLEALGKQRAKVAGQLETAEAVVARLTPMAETVRNAKLKDWEPAIQGISAILNGTVDKNGRVHTKGLYRDLRDAQEKIAARFDKATSVQEAVVRRVAEAEIIFGDASLAANNVAGVREHIVPMIVEKIEAAKSVIDSKPKVSGKFDDKARTEITTWARNAQNILDRLEADPENKALALLAEAHLASAYSRDMEQIVTSSEELLKKLKAGFASKETVAMLNEGWVRLGGFSDEELKNMKRIRKGLDKEDPDKALLRNRKSIDLGMPGLQVPQAVADAMENITKNLSGSNGIVQATQFLSKYTQFFKAYATASPGFHVRNAISDFFSMLSGGADLRYLNEARAHLAPYINDPDNWLKNIPQAQRANAEIAMKAALASGSGQFSDALDEFMVRGDTWIYNNKLLNLLQRTGHKQDFMRRYMFAYDRVKKGMDFEKATADTRRFLIDYMNPSAADEALRNIVPFWTFMSRNLPNQLTNRWTNPRAYAMYNSFVRNMDQSDENDVVPSYMREQGAFKIAGRTWLQPDLPMTRVNQQLAELAQPNRLLSYVNPLLRLPIELAGNTKLYTNQQFSDKPQDLTFASKLASPLLALTGQLQQDATGAIKTSEKANYALMNLLPPLATAERLFPSTDSYAQKRGASVASFFGIPVRNYTQDMEDKEAKSRTFAMQQYLQRQKALGFGEK